MADGEPETVAQLSQLYLGNILYALERCAMSLDAEGNDDGGRYYRSIARALADAHGRTHGRAGRPPSAPSVNDVVEPNGDPGTGEHA